MKEVYQKYLQNPAHYDRMVALLRHYNPDVCKTDDQAQEVIHSCIRVALSEGDCSTGCCMALRTREGKIRLFLEPLRPNVLP